MSTRAATPLYFGRSERPIFGWLHHASTSAAAPAPTPAPTLGLVICNPFGYEAVCAHRSLRHFAEAAAAAGVPALRFDYDGTGDSAGDDREPKRLEAWIDSVHDAIDFVKRTTGASRVVLLGVRLGALIATLAATSRRAVHGEDNDLDGLIAIAPVVMGKTHLRELRALQAAGDRREPPSGAVIEEGVQEALGFAITSETQKSIQAVDLTKLDKRPTGSVLLIERDDLPGGTASDAWPDRLTAQGVAVDRRRLEGYVEMMLGPQDAQVPRAMVDAATTWLSARAANGASSKSSSAHPSSATVESVADEPRARITFTIPFAEHARGDPRVVIETPVRVDASGRLFGVLSMPPPAEAAGDNATVANARPSSANRRGLLLLNAGSVHHIGSNRLYVTLARRWAALGHRVLRMDISGIGDSAPRPGDPENVVYIDDAHLDVAAGVSYLRNHAGASEVYALGLCSGGYHAFKAVIADVALTGVMVINPLTFFYKPGMPLEAAPHLVTGEASRYGRRLRNLDAWKKLFRGEVHLDAAARVMVRRVRNMASDRARDVARRVGIRVADDLAFELRAIAKKNVALRFLFAAGDPGVTLLAAQGGKTVDKLRRNDQLGIDMIEGADHTFTPLWSHRIVIEKIAAQLDHPSSSASSSSSAAAAAAPTTATATPQSESQTRQRRASSSSQ